MAELIKASIIVPMYKVEPYLRRCLSSLAAQEFRDFEVLMIDDGSPDHSARIAREFAAADPRFRLIQKENGGVATARNAGLDAARGEYVAFVDGDDFVSPRYLSVLYGEAERTGAQVVCCGYMQYFPKSGKSAPYPFHVRTGLHSGQAMVKALLHDVLMQSYLWNKLWKRELFTRNNIRFPLIRFEDMATAIRLFYCAESVAVLAEPLYYYSQHSGSIVHTFRPEVENDFLRSFALLRLFLEQQNAYPVYRRHFRFYMMKSLFFIWGVIFLMHLEESNFGGFGGNCRRATAYLNYYASGQFQADMPEPNWREIVLPPREKRLRRARRAPRPNGGYEL